MAAISETSMLISSAVGGVEQLHQFVVIIIEFIHYAIKSEVEVGRTNHNEETILLTYRRPRCN